MIKDFWRVSFSICEKGLGSVLDKFKRGEVLDGLVVD